MNIERRTKVVKNIAPFHYSVLLDSKTYGPQNDDTHFQFPCNQYDDKNWVKFTGIVVYKMKIVKQQFSTNVSQ